MNELSIIRYAGTEAADSRQVAEAIGKEHKELRMCQSVDAVAFVMDWQPDDRLQEKLYFATPKPDLSLLNALFPGEEEE